MCRIPVIEVRTARTAGLPTRQSAPVRLSGRTSSFAGKPTRNFYTVRQFAEAHLAFSEASLRWQIFSAQENGLAESGALLRLGRRVLIDAARFYEWLDGQQPKNAA